MMEHFGIVAEQVMILFILIAVGYLCNKKGLLSKEENKKISNLLVLIVAPMEYLAGLNVPLPMLVVGHYLADTDLKKMFADKKVTLVFCCGCSYIRWQSLGFCMCAAFAALC